MSNFSLPGESNINDLAQYYEQRFNRIETSIGKILAAGPTTLHKVDVDVYDAPTENEIVIDWPRGRFCYFHDDEWICFPDDPEHAIKVFQDAKPNVAGDGVFRFDVEESLHNHEIIRVEAFNGTAGGGTSNIQISNRGRNLDVLTTPLIIPGGQLHDNNTATIKKTLQGGLPANYVRWKDPIWIDADTVSGQGLGVYIRFRRGRIDVLDV